MSEDKITQKLIDFGNSRAGAIWMRKYVGEDVSDPVLPGKDMSVPSTECSNIIFVSFNSDFPFKSNDRIIVLNYDLVSDIIYEIGFKLAELVPSVNIENKHNLILDFISERFTEYEKFLKLTIMELKELLLNNNSTVREFEFIFPDSYVIWLIYSSDNKRQKIGEKLKEIGGKIHIGIQEFIEDYFQEDYLEEELICKIRSIIEEDSYSRYISFVDCPAPRQSLISSVRKEFPNLTIISSEEGFVYNLLAQAYEYGRGVERNEEKAFHYFQLAAERNYPFAIYKLGLIYKEGCIVNRDLQKAKEYFNNALAAGFKPNKYQPIDV